MSEFKAFALKGNMVDLAVGVVVGGAFGKVVSAIVADVKEVVAAPTTKQCSECLETIPAAAKRCRACTAALIPATI